MRIAIVGPTHPYKGGIAQHTTELAHRLESEGYEVELISWKNQYPFFYPGAQFVPQDKPELPPYMSTKRVLSWKNPAGWLRWGRKLKNYDEVILIWWVPTIQGPVYLNMIKAMGKNKPVITIICHNVLAHHPKAGDRALTKAVLGRANRLITHTDEQAKLATSLVSTETRTAALPLTLQGQAPPKSRKKPLRHQLLFFGFVRPYKGLDVLLKALAEVPDIKLHIAGEFWGKPETYFELIDELGLGKRVTVEAGYVPSEKISSLLEQSDALVLPYKSGTASWNVALAHAHGTPVISTAVGSMPTQIRDNIDGLLCTPNSVQALSSTIKHFYETGVAERLAHGVPSLNTDRAWQAYIKTLLQD